MKPIDKKYLKQLARFIDTYPKDERYYNCPFDIEDSENHFSASKICDNTCRKIFPSSGTGSYGGNCPCNVLDRSYVSKKCAALLKEQYYNKGQ